MPAGPSAMPIDGIPYFRIAIVWPDIVLSLSGVVSLAFICMPGMEKPLPTTTLTFSSRVIFFTMIGTGSFPNWGAFSWAETVDAVTTVKNATARAMANNCFLIFRILYGLKVYLHFHTSKFYYI